MKIADMHCDTILRLYNENKKAPLSDLRKNNFHIDLEKMKKADYLLQNFACFIYLKDIKEPFCHANKLIDLFESEVSKNTDLIKQVRTYKEIEKNIESNIMSALLTLEEGEACEGSIDKLEHFYDRGVRMMTLTWNYENSLAFPNRKISDKEGRYLRSEADTKNGLKKRGFEFIERMQELGMIIDVSHLSDAGIFDVLKNTKKPFVASHSNARAVAENPRNLSDEMIKAMAQRGCVAGLNFYSGFLRNRTKGEKDFSYLEDVARQALYMLDKGGEDFVGLGSDYDGIDSELEWKNAQGTYMILETFKKFGLSSRLIDKICSTNVLRLYKEVLS